MKDLFCCINGGNDSDDEHHLPDAAAIEKSASSRQNAMQLKIIPMGPSGFLGKLQLSERDVKENSAESKFVTIVILDRSGSMGQWVKRVVQEILPQTFKNLGYQGKDIIHLMAFNDYCETLEVKVGELEGKKDLYAFGGTSMVPVMKKLNDLLPSFQKNYSGIRILAVSDGAIFDQKETKKMADQIVAEFKGKFKFNSQAIQIFSSTCASPDTTALCSLLQINNTKNPEIINIFHESDIKLMVRCIADSFRGDGMEFSLKLKSSRDQNLFKSNLWDKDFVSEINLNSGENLFWIDPSAIDQLISGETCMSLRNRVISISLEEPVKDAYKVSTLLDKQLRSIFDYLKVLKMIGSSTSQMQMHHIVEIYRELESQLTLEGCGDAKIVSNEISSRLGYLKQEMKKRFVGFTFKMAQIANDNAIDQLNSAQKADYLRSTTHSKTSRGLAKRAATSGLDFDQTARDEVLKIAANIQELADIDDSAHQVSFYSMETTLGALRSLASLPEMAGFDNLTARDILLLLNIVGIACKGPVGDFPDPMTWRVNTIYPGTFVSVSDILTSKIQCGDPDHLLQVPGQVEETISAVIPIFEDERLAEFIKKHAPHLLSYSCSIGMRGMIAHINMTDGYTLCAGIWKLVEHVAKTPSELNLKTFEHLCRSFNLFAAGYFSSSRVFLLAEEEEENKGRSMYLQGNGLTNLIAPMYGLFSQESLPFKRNLPAILRAIFAYEIWQVLRRDFKGEDSCNKISGFLTELLGIDLQRDAYKFPPPFAPQDEIVHKSEIKFHDKAEFNYDRVKEIFEGKGWYLKYIAIIGILLEGAAKGSLQEEFKSKTSLEERLKDETFLCKQFGLPEGYSFSDFLMFSTIQALLFPTAKGRIDKDQKLMLFDDLIDPTSTENLIRQHIRTQFVNQYERDRVARQKKELEILMKEFLQTLASCTDRKELIKVFKEGVSRNNNDPIYTYLYKGPSSYGNQELKALLTDTTIAFPLRKDAIKLFLHAIDTENNGDIIYNNGRSGMVEDIEAFQRAFIHAGGAAAEWPSILALYKENSVHLYRDSPCNRHGHHNGKPSYWALGFMTLEKFAQYCSTEDFKDYCKVHFNCCGVNQLPKSGNDSDSGNDSGSDSDSV